jgi:hypothetical protein
MGFSGYVMRGPSVVLPRKPPAVAWISTLFFLLWLSAWPQTARCYSVLTHEEIVDIAWKDDLRPVLLKRFPQATEEQLRKAHGFAYGGCVMQDMGYYPLGNKFFSDLTHYVRSGDFVTNLIIEATNLNEYAFALGALAHYCADTSGHPGVNQAVALSFPDLRSEFGDSVTYADNPEAHIRVEFGFDMTQVAKNRYTSDAYHDFIGFQVSKPILERAFYKTYGLRLDEVLTPVDRSIGTFRRAVSRFIPELTRVALEVHGEGVLRTNGTVGTISERNFLYNLSRSEYEKEWGKDYRKPRLLARILGFILRWVPKFGPFKALAFKIPSPQTEEIYLKSVNTTVGVYRSLLREIGTGHIELANVDFDTGRPPRAGEYILADRTYEKLLDKLSNKGLERTDPQVERNILEFFDSAHLIGRNARDRRAWKNAELQLQKLRDLQRESESPKI